MIRLFVGLELPLMVRQQLHLMSGGIPNARWTELGNYHLTLVFIGPVEEPVAAEIDAALMEIRSHPFELALSGAGQFDRGGHTRVVWAGVAANPALVHLQEKIRTCLRRIGVSVDQRKFSPHITLARIGHAAPQDRIFRFLAEHGLFATAPFGIEHFTLFESLRGSGAPVYLPIKEYQLPAGT